MPNKGMFGHRSTPRSHYASESPRNKAIMEIAERAQRQMAAERSKKPSGLRKAADFAGNVANSATRVGSNIDALLKTVSGKRLKLPKTLRRGLDDPLLGVSGNAENIERLVRKRLDK